MSLPSHLHPGATDDPSTGTRMGPQLNEILRLLHIDRLANSALFNTWSRASHLADEAKFIAWVTEFSSREQVAPLWSEFQWRANHTYKVTSTNDHPRGSGNRSVTRLGKNNALC